jgi:hypothetical protein
MDSNPNIGQFDKSFSRQLDTSAFSVPDNFVKGRSATGVIRGPGQMNVDLSAAKKFVVHDFLHANIRGDFFNAFNHSQWTGVAVQVHHALTITETKYRSVKLFPGKKVAFFS